VHLLKALARNESGATAIEYAMIAAMIAVALVGVLQQVGIELQKPFAEAADGLKLRPWGFFNACG
jgi:pilus assembly protein Flp/PilA